MRHLQEGGASRCGQRSLWTMTWSKRRKSTPGYRKNPPWCARHSRHSSSAKLHGDLPDWGEATRSEACAATTIQDVILVDTSIWVDHLRIGDELLQDLLAKDQVLLHPFVFGELALGSLRHRAGTLFQLRQLPTVNVAHHDEVMRLVEQAILYGLGSQLHRRARARCYTTDPGGITLVAGQEPVCCRREAVCRRTRDPLIALP